MKKGALKTYGAYFGLAALLAPILFVLWLAITLPLWGR